MHVVVERSTVGPMEHTDTITIDGVQFHENLKYEPLEVPQSQIRLLRLRPERVAIDVSTDTLPNTELSFNCSIETVDLSHDIPPYLAVSYVWGDPTNLYPIVCNGQIKQITRNLWDFLSQCWVRTHGELKTDIFSEIVSFGRPMWIDAVCINQSDLDEKSQQVRQMGQIYSQAARVIMWLGSHSELAEDAQDVMIPLDTRGTIDYDPCPPRADSGLTALADLDTKWEVQAEREEMLEVLDHILNQFSHDDWKSHRAFNELMQLDYWSRAWVVQEMALANHNEAIVMIGGKVWAWATLVNAAHTLMIVMYLFNAGKDWPAIKEWPKDKTLTLRYNAVILDRFVSGTMSAESLTLAEIMPWAMFRTTRATLLVDHIYSLLSLATDSQTCGIIPSYTKSVSHVYQDVTEYLLRTMGADALTFCELCRTAKLWLPSWVPNFSYHNVWTLKIPRPKSQTTRLYGAGGSRSDFSYQIQGRSLHLRGRRIDAICHFAQIMEHQDDLNRDDATAWLNGFQKFVDEAAASYGTDPTNAWRVPIADRIDLDQSLGVRAPDRVKNAYTELLHHDDVSVLSRDAINYAGALMMLSACRTPFVTQRGHLGLGGSCARKGDVLWICTGADTPLILREIQRGKFMIVAEAFLSGFMHGEALKIVEEEEIEII